MQNPKNVFENNTLIHLPGFYIIGLNSLPYANAYVIFLTVLYILTTVFNCFVICVICIDHQLHYPKFIALGNLAVVDLLISTSLIPAMIKICIFKDTFIEIKLCLMQMFIYIAFISLESHSLAVLAFDRLIAICFPLRQNVINTTTTMISIIIATYVLSISVAMGCLVSLIYLSFCNSLQVNSYFCDYAPIFRLACNNTSVQWTYATVLVLVELLVPLSFIVLTYTCILIAVFRMKSVQSRFKALATCTEHLMLVTVFYIPMLVISILGYFRLGLNQDVRIAGLSLSSCIPPFANPIIYSLKTKKLRNRVYFVFERICVIKRYLVYPLHKKCK
ncbi:olfactory receptor 52K2-like [Electrophorus electricus]|uniref:G-protein coupled receptors family 1 profile domain-containing protein n=1 Tax=Electrophorus electricus TaxID=8005 RepID=A0A4W4GJA3_ELEEL|nr:olfactory receptor 52K2-like [Electrophorus electricus]